MSKKQKPNWFIHLVTNGPCLCGCGNIETSFLPNLCNAHTHGMEKYNHPDFQVVLRYEASHIGYILNTFGEMVRSGREFHAGEMVHDIYEDCPVRLDEYEETGRTVLRIIIPDMNGRFPEDDNCDEMYKLQLLPTDALYKNTEDQPS